MVVGRATDCQLVLQSCRVSRRHARLTFTDAGLAVQDLGSANGVFVNGDRIKAPTSLSAGDEIMLGDEVLTVIPARVRPAELERVTLPGMSVDTLPGRASASVSVAIVPPEIRPTGKETSMRDATVREDILALIGTVADKMLALNKAAEAERILRPRLQEVLSRAQTDSHVPEQVADAAGRYAVKLADAKHDPAWIEYTFDLFSVLKRPLPSDVIEFLYTLLRGIPPIRIESLRGYIQQLESASAGFQPGQRFLVKRIRGLEGLASAR